VWHAVPPKLLNGTQHGPKTLIHLVVLLLVFMMLHMMTQGKVLPPLTQSQMSAFGQPLLKALFLRPLLCLKLLFPHEMLEQRSLFGGYVNSRHNHVVLVPSIMYWRHACAPRMP
jgi:hypothetical protein